MKQTKKPARKIYRYISPTIQLFLAVGLFVVAVAASRSPEMAPWEVALFNSIYTLPDFLWPIFIVVTQFGSIFALAVLVIIYLIYQRYHIVLRLLITGTLAYQLSGFAKDIWGRMRPTEMLIDVISRDYLVRGPGFPSGHTAFAVALALTIGHYLPKKYHWIVPVWIIGVGLSRVYLGVHAPLDIVGGFAIGWFSYALFRHVRLYDVSYIHKKLKS